MALQKKQFYKNKSVCKSGTNKPRFTFGKYTDLELILSLNTVDKFATWISKSFIVNANQRPRHLYKVPQKTKDKIIFINHIDIIPNHLLPTFNSVVIEIYLHNIPNLSTFFLYSNDDTYF